MRLHLISVDTLLGGPLKHFFLLEMWLVLGLISSVRDENLALERSRRALSVSAAPARLRRPKIVFFEISQTFEKSSKQKKTFVSLSIYKSKTQNDNWSLPCYCLSLWSYE